MRFPVYTQRTCNFRRIDDSLQNLQPPPVQSALLTPCDTQKQSFSFNPHSLPCKKKKEKREESLPPCFYPSLKPSAPTSTSRDHRRGLSCSHESCDVEWDRKVEKKSEGIKNSWRGALVFAPLNLHTSCLRAGWSYHHTTLHKQTSCHPWHRHTIWCAITAGMFPELVFHVCVATWGTSAELIFMRARTFLLS